MYVEKPNTENFKRFDFEYAAYAVHLNYPKRHPEVKKRHCQVELYQNLNKVEIFVTEDDSTERLKDKKLNFADIVFQLRQAGHYGKIQWVNEDAFQVTWYKREPLDHNGRDIIYRVKIGERSDWTFRDKITFVKKLVFGDYRARGIGFIEDHCFVIRTGSVFRTSPHVLPLSLYPELQNAKDEDRNDYITSKNRMAIYWPKLQLKLFVKDAVIFGERLMPKPDGVSIEEFLEEKLTPRLN